MTHETWIWILSNAPVVLGGAVGFYLSVALLGDGPFAQKGR